MPRWCPGPDVVRCEAPRRHPRWPGQRCRGFVARVPAGVRYRVLRRLRHSSESRDRCHVAGCLDCGALHEIEMRPEPAWGRVVDARA